MNGARVGPRAFFSRADSGVIVDGRLTASPYRVQAVGAPGTISVALTRVGGIVGQLGLIYGRTRLTVSEEKAIDLPAAPSARRRPHMTHLRVRPADI